MYRLTIPLLLTVFTFPVFAEDDTESSEVVAADTDSDASEPKSAETPMPENTPNASDETTDAATSAVSQSVTSQPVPSAKKSALTVEWGSFTPNPTTLTAMSPQSGIDAVVQPLGIQRSSKRASPHPVVWKTDTEWVSANIGISTYGASANMTFATLRWPNMYWDTVKFFGGAWKRTVHFFGASTVGMPFWISARHEFRVGTGISVGYLRFRQPISEDDAEFAGSGITVAKVKTYVSLPLEARYVYHYRRHLAFELCTMVAFPMNYKIVFEAHSNVDPEDYDADYRPFVFGGAGLRF